MAVTTLFENLVIIAVKSGTPAGGCWINKWKSVETEVLHCLWMNSDGSQTFYYWNKLKLNSASSRAGRKPTSISVGDLSQGLMSFPLGDWILSAATWWVLSLLLHQLSNCFPPNATWQTILIMHLFCNKSSSDSSLKAHCAYHLQILLLQKI